MRQPFSHKSDFRPGGLWLLVYGGMAVIESALPHFLSVKSPLFELVQIALVCLIGLFSLYTGMKKFHQRQERQPQARWYMQPSILGALGIFFSSLSHCSSWLSESQRWTCLCGRSCLSRHGFAGLLR